MMKNILFYTLLFFSSLMMTGLSSAQEPMRLQQDENPLIIQTLNKSTELKLEIADDDEKRMRGLMFRTDLPQNSAMLFVFERPRMITMWMRNTPLPLDMLFLDEQGVVKNIHKNAQPFSESLISSGTEVSYVVELHAGDADRFDIKSGDKVMHQRICGACK